MKIFKLLPILILFNLLIIISSNTNNKALKIYGENFYGVAPIKIKFIILNEKNIEDVLYEIGNLKYFYNFKKYFIENKMVTCKFFENNKNKSVVVIIKKSQSLEDLCKD